MHIMQSINKPPSASTTSSTINNTITATSTNGMNNANSSLNTSLPSSPFQNITNIDKSGSIGNQNSQYSVNSGVMRLDGTKNTNPALVLTTPPIRNKSSHNSNNNSDNKNNDNNNSSNMKGGNNSYNNSNPMSMSDYKLREKINMLGTADDILTLNSSLDESEIIDHYIVDDDDEHDSSKSISGVKL